METIQQKYQGKLKNLGKGNWFIENGFLIAAVIYLIIVFIS